jgi:hypothetical protein
MLRFSKYLVLTVIAAIFLWGCSRFIKAVDGDQRIILDAPNDKLALMFSANINGETHPCGCRHFPLGGLDHVAGLFHKESANTEAGTGKTLFYVDTGDIFFPSNNVPPTVMDSLSYTANSIAHALNLLGLKYFVPGDQDLTLGSAHLESLLKQHQLKMLVANRGENFPFPSQGWIKLEKNQSKIYLIGITLPETFRAEHRYLFTDPIPALGMAIKEIESDGYEKDNLFHRLIILSHGGMDFDRSLAKAFPQTDWVVGSHTQSFIKIPFQEGKTQLVQVMARNHYLGKIEIALNADRSQDTYTLLETRDDLAAQYPNNPLTPFLHKHKEELAKVQLEEQKKLTVSYDDNLKKYDTAKSCLECHTKQGTHWGKTPHSLAWLTLVKAKADNNPACIQCHSLGQGEQRGFQSTAELINFEISHSHDGNEHAHTSIQVSELNENDLKKLEKTRALYWKNLLSKMPTDKSIRELPPKMIQQAGKIWMQQDEKFKVTHNFANVQCLNCHTKHPDHPFNMSSDNPDPKDQRPEQIKAKCLSCHNADQSPEWYSKDADGRSGNLNQAYFDKVYKKVACPRS